MSTLRTLLKPPVFEDETKTQQAYMLHIILWTLVLVPIPFAIYTLVIAQENMARAIVQIIFGESVNIFLLILLRRGFVRLASVRHVTLISTDRRNAWWAGLDRVVAREWSHLSLYAPPTEDIIPG